MEGLRVIGPGERKPDVTSGALLREAAISGQMVGAEKLWVGWAELGPGLVSGVHHHGEAESAIFIVSGNARFHGGADLDEVHDAGPGDFIWVPPHFVHVELNRSDTEPVRMIVARSTQEGIVVNVPAPEGWTHHG